MLQIRIQKKNQLSHFIYSRKHDYQTSTISKSELYKIIRNKCIMFYQISDILLLIYWMQSILHLSYTHHFPGASSSLSLIVITETAGEGVSSIVMVCCRTDAIG